MKKNILIMGLGRQFGGTEKYIINIINNIDNENYNIHICVNKNSLLSNNLKKFNYRNIKIIEIDASKKRIMKSLKQVKKYIVDQSIDVIHNNGVLTELITSLSTIKMKNILIISTVHGFSSFDRMDRSKFERFVFETLEKKMFKYSDIYISVSDSIKKYLVSRGLDNNKVVVIHHGIDKSKEVIYSKENLRNKNIQIGSIGRIESVKGYEYLIKAIKILVDNGYKIHCNILGDGLELERVKSLAKQLGIEKNVCFLGFSDEIDDFLKGLDIYVQPSIQESFGISILEAMNNSRPIVASNVGGIPEIIENNKNGILFNAKDHIDLADKIESLICDDVKRCNIANNGRVRFVNCFTIEAFIEKLTEIYNYDSL